MGRTTNRVTGVVIRDEKILLIHRLKAEDEYWVFPGGGVEDGEDLDSALKREVVEETGLNLTSYRRIFDQLDANGNTCIFYSCQLEPGEPQIGGPELEEQSESNRFSWEWINLDKLATIGTVYPRPFKLLDWLTQN
jgi:8-oxo-dGTP pyrophosphatase MutT (NUDIX family)